MIKFSLPYPPTQNTMYPTYKGRRILSKKGREYKTECFYLIKQHGFEKIKGKVEMRIDMYLPDNRRRDVDNAAKAVMDVCVEGALIEDDSMVDILLLNKSWGVDRDNPRVEVSVEGLEMREKGGGAWTFPEDRKYMWSDESG